MIFKRARKRGLFPDVRPSRCFERRGSWGFYTPLWPFWTSNSLSSSMNHFVFRRLSDAHRIQLRLSFEPSSIVPRGLVLFDHLYISELSVSQYSNHAFQFRRIVNVQRTSINRYNNVHTRVRPMHNTLSVLRAIPKRSGGGAHPGAVLLHDNARH